jgi:hypothetical protein
MAAAAMQAREISRKRLHVSVDAHLLEVVLLLTAYKEIV